MVGASVSKRGGSSAPAAADRPLRLLALVPRPVGISPGQRYRLEQWAPHLKSAHGISIDFAPFESSGLTRALDRQGHTIEKVARVGFDFLRRSAELAESSPL
jgi:hypothetical protein